MTSGDAYGLTAAKKMPNFMFPSTRLARLQAAAATLAGRGRRLVGLLGAAVGLDLAELGALEDLRVVLGLLLQRLEAGEAELAADAEVDALAVVLGHATAPDA